jgi:hypothetical protein
VRNKYAVDPDDTTSAARVKWWETLPLNDAEPYATAAWAYTQTVVEVEEDSDEPGPLGDQDDLDVEGTPWWETIGGEGPKPYAAAAWTYIYDSDLVIELVAVSTTELTRIDAGYVDDPEFRGDYDAGTFGNPADIYIDGVFYTSTGYAIEVKRTFAEIKVYDSLASSPGPLPLIAEPIGNLVTEPNGGGDIVLLDPSTLGDTDLGTDPNVVQLETDIPPLESQEVLVNGGGFDGFAIEFQRPSTSQDDIPPGQLLGQINYEIFGSVATVTSWEHYNWEDDTPIRKAVEAMLNGLPESVIEVRVLDDPTAFWQSLGFNRAYKGDPYIHYFPG